MFDRKNITIGSLITVAVLLAVAHFSLERRARAETVTSSDFMIVTARSNKGGDALLVLNNRTGMIAAFRPEGTTTGLQLKLKDVRPMADLLAGTPAPGNPPRYR